MEHLEAIAETSYLSVPSAPVYRKIMRCFFREYEKMNFQLYKEDVLTLLKQDREFEDYTAEELDQDLQALVRWKNLTPIQDPGRVYTISEYKNKQYRYTMTEYAVEIERLTVRLENVYLESGNLSTNFFVRLAAGLEEAPDMVSAALKDVNQWWQTLQEDFRRLNQNYQDYLRDFYSGKTEHLMKSVEFVIHKDKFIRYLNEFIQELQHYSRRIENILSGITADMEKTLVERIVESELDIPKAMTEVRGNKEKDILDNVQGRWNSLKNWFIDSPQRECESKKVLRITNDIIRSIIQNAALIVQIQNWGISRKDDYRRFIEMFMDCGNLDEAHCLAAHVFGIQQIRHFKAEAPADSDSVSESIYDGEASDFLLKSHSRGFREKKDRSGFADKTIEKLMQKERYLKSIRNQKDIVMKYIKDGCIVFSEIEDTVSESTRNVFLQWISQANMNSGKKGRTEYGQEYRLVRKKGQCTLHCEDGDLVMPEYVLKFDI